MTLQRRSAIAYLHAEKDHPQRFPDPDSPELFAGVKRNFQVFQPLDFLAAVLQHIPDKGEHPIRYYGYYSNKARGMRAKRAAAATPPGDPAANSEPKPCEAAEEPPPALSPLAVSVSKRSKGRWAMLIKRIYHADPLRCPRCGGTMKIIAFIEACQGDLIRKILEHCGLWHDPPPRAPPRPPPPAHPQPKAGPPTSDPDSSLTYEVDSDFLEYQRQEDQEPPDPASEP